MIPYCFADYTMPSCAYLQQKTDAEIRKIQRISPDFTEKQFNLPPTSTDSTPYGYMVFVMNP